MGKSNRSRAEDIQQRPPAKTPEGREQQLTAMAMDAAEKRIRNGTASAQEIVYFAKLGSPTAKLERKILEQQHELLAAKTEAIQSQKRVEELYVNALSAMRAYSGDSSNSGDDDY